MHRRRHRGDLHTVYGEIEKAGGFSEAAGQIGYPGISRGIFYEMGFSPTWKPIPELIRRFKGRSRHQGQRTRRLGLPGATQAERVRPGPTGSIEAPVVR